MKPLSLSTSWNSGRHTDGADMLRQIRDMGFTHAELGHGIRFSLWPGVLDAVEQGVIQISSLHNFCPVPLGVMRPSPNCYELTSPVPSIRRCAISCTIETIRNAAKLNVHTVVLHLGSSGMRRITGKLERLHNRGQFLSRLYIDLKLTAVKRRRALFPSVWARLHESLKPIVEEAAKQQVRLGCEIRERFEEFPNEEEFQTVLDAFPAETLGYWHDFGHAARKEFLGWHDHFATLQRRAPRLIGCHIHDCRPPDEDHQALGEGEIPFPKLIPLLPDDITPVLEYSPRVSEAAVLASQNLWNSYTASAVTLA
jgi:sugar phosphate isomerase/epimerase